MTFRNALAAMLLFPVFSLTCFARGVHIPSYDELFTKSDFILIVRPGITRDAKPDDVTQPLGVSGLDDFVTAVVTPLKVLRVVKGKFKDDHMDLPHYRLDMEKMQKNGHQGLGNGPCLVDFAVKKKDVGEFDDIPSDRDYMLFLKMHNGQLGFYTGQFDPEFSVFRLAQPTP